MLMGSHDAHHVTEGTFREVAALFVRLGTVAFGGPAAHIAMMHDECVKRRQWLTDQEFTDLLGATNLIPGPNSTELAIHIGVRRAGWKGLVASALFILPAVAIVLALAWAYVRYSSLPAVEWILYGIKPVMIAIVANAIWSLRNAFAKDAWTIGAAVLALALHLLGRNELLLLLGLGAIVMLVKVLSDRRRGGPTAGVALLGFPKLSLGAGSSAGAGAAAMASGFVAASGMPLLVLFLVFLKIGAVLYGSGYVLLAFLEGDFVHRLGWLTEAQLIDAVSIGQVTPGPVFTTATFIGYVVGSWQGAAVATIGIFLPSFVFVALTHRWVPRLRDNPWSAGFLDGVNAAAIGLMASVTWSLGRAAVVDPLTVGLAVVSLVLLAWKKVNATCLILGGGLVSVGYALATGVL